MADLRHASARPVPGPAGRSAFVIGNVGRLGEELLAAVLADPRYTRVSVGVRMAMRTVMSNFVAVPVPDGRAVNPAALGSAPEDLFICIEPPPESFWKRATPYVAMTSEQSVASTNRWRQGRASGSRWPTWCCARFAAS